MFTRPGDTMMDGRPGDVRGFIHKKVGRFLGGAARTATGIVSQLGIPVVSGVAGTVGRFIPGGRQTSLSPLPRSTPGSAFNRFLDTTLTNIVECGAGFIQGPLGICIPIPGAGTPEIVPGLPPLPTGGGGVGVIPGTVPEGFACRSLPGGEKVCDMVFGGAVMGRYGAALQPAQGNTWINRCPTGTVLGKDGLCYNKRDISNSERKWPKGRAPLLTGGQMRAIGVASTAAKKLERTTKRLQAMGMMKKPSRTSRKALPPVRNVTVEHGPGSIVG